MPKYTPNLNLYEIDPETDGFLTFNLDTMLSNNFNIIDAAHGALVELINNITSSFSQFVSVPVGTVIYTAKNTPPSNFLRANGAAVSRVTYAALFGAIGTIYGAGDGSTTFNLPDLRGEFVRGWDDSRGVDSGRAFGSSQSDMLKSHSHSVTHGVSGGNAGWDGVETKSGANTTGATGGSETRPRNVALLACIRY